MITLHLFDLQFTKLARDLKVPGGGASKKSAASAASGDGAAAEAADDEGESLDLC
jgi:hypothetical protein